MSDAEVATPRPKEDSEASTPKAAEQNTNGVSEIASSPAGDNELPKVSVVEKEMIEKALDIPAEEAKEEVDKKEITNKDDAKDLESKGAGDCSANLKPAQNNESLEVKSATPDSPADIADNPTITDQSPAPTPAINGSSTSLEGKTSTPSMKERDPSELVILELKQALQKTMEDRDNYRKKFDSTKEQLTTLQASYDAMMAGGNDDNIFKQMIEQLRCQLVQTSLLLDDKSRLNANQEKQINALGNQVASLKEVETLTRSLLQIRNMEVKHLQAEVDDMEKRINQERERYNTMINKMDSAVQLNSDLKKEYETQLSLFKNLKEKYEEKVVLLTEEKRALEGLEVAQATSD